MWILLKDDEYIYVEKKCFTMLLKGKYVVFTVSQNQNAIVSCYLFL